eukprot:CAMPEP_0171974676 /NCGR_PEP_ID=MMETSP0993-20121228/233575_1 /TAXON_ID=483369 /ORGANISM="non described non described, Strain CCMP2098" /LENGTH=60 /DNA_ID=CAMNT_0012625743 /DNA_START=66 /DNA_END=249 /DNA_ORIENTATION=+
MDEHHHGAGAAYPVGIAVGAVGFASVSVVKDVYVGAGESLVPPPNDEEEDPAGYDGASSS